MLSIIIVLLFIIIMIMIMIMNTVNPERITSIIINNFISVANLTPI